MTDRITGRGADTSTASGPRGSGAAGGYRSGAPGAMPGSSATAMRGAPTTTNASMPNVRSYNECRAWLAQMPRDSKALNRGPMQGGEITLADQDLCARFPRG